MEDTNTFLGAKRNTIMMVGVIVAICAPALTMIATVIGLFSMMNSSINRLDNNITALRAEQKEELSALRAEQKAEISELSKDIDALSAEVIELKLETTQIRVSVDETAMRMREIESVDVRLDEIEREQAQIKERLDALAAE